MKIINPSFEILTNINGNELINLEKGGRTCYKSDSEYTVDSSIKFVRNIIKSGHLAVIEHSLLTVKFICDRGVSHELVRHRIASFCQESTRYCNYSNDKFGNELTFIKPCFFEEDSERYKTWSDLMEEIEKTYLEMLSMGCKPEEARSVLPNSIKTEVVMSANYREWRHFFALRACDATGKAHPQMKELAIPLLKKVSKLIPVVFDDLVSEVE